LLKKKKLFRRTVVTYTLKRSKRKTIGLTITANAELIVRAPRLTPKFYIDRVVQRKQAWILRHLEKVRHRQAPAPKFGEGETVWHFGQSYKITFDDLKKPILMGQNIILPKTNDPKSNLLAFYKESLQNYLLTKVDAYAAQMNLVYKGLKVTSAKKRLGSCNTRQNLCFSYRCAVMPEWVIDYIIVHELAHLREMNHSDRFWKIVATHFPDYKQAKKWIRENLEQISVV
jgi:hypothetical protein